MKKKKNNMIYFVIILTVAILDIIYGTIFQVNKYIYNQKAVVVKANIHQISKNKDVNTLYLDYRINKKLYNGVMTVTDKSITVEDDLTIYCNKDNPTKFTNGEIPFTGYFIMVLGIVIVFVDFKVFYKKRKNK